ncbi:MAG: glycosyltransferase, partial [Tepidisphaeraceae bacterium]
IEAFVGEHPDCVVVCSTLSLGARVAQDKLGFPMASAHLAPSAFRSVHEPPRAPGLFMPKWLPMWVKEKIWEGGDRWFIDPLIAPALNKFRAEKGLPPVKDVLKDWWHSPDRVIGLFPEWFAQVQPDWPPQTRLTGFPQFDESDVEALPDELESFLRAGDAPIAFTPGSAMVQGREFFRAAAGACRRLNRRGLLLSRFPEQIPTELPSGVIHVHYAPFSQLLPRVAALVHHGGAGTTAQALRAGVPQVITPMAHDQLDNCLRVRRLGVGEEIHPRRLGAGILARKLSRLLDDPAVRHRCRQVASKFAGHDPLAETCDIIQALYRPTGTHRPAPVLAGLK